MVEPREIDDGGDDVEATVPVEPVGDGDDEVEGFLLKSGNLLGAVPVPRPLPPDQQRQIARDT